MPLRRLTVPELAGMVDGVVLRRWRVSDAAALQEAVLASLDHLRPWMEWVADEPVTLAERRAMLVTRTEDWERGREFVYGAFLGDLIVGVFGLHRRIGRGGLELGYWVREGYTGRGIGRGASRLLTDVALSARGINHVEIHHDRANLRSAAIPRALGFTLLGEFPDRIEAPAECGIECRWRMTAADWRAGRTQSPAGCRTVSNVAR